MARRPTIADVATEAGVSVATVDRVLNGRHKVRQETARRVLQAARKIGYHATNLIEQRLKSEWPQYRFGFVFHKEKHDFYRSLAAEAARAVAQAPLIRGWSQVLFSPSHAPEDFAERLLALEGRVDAIAATAVAHPTVTEAVARLKAGGIPVFALLNDFAPGVRQNYVGLNNLKVGRVAGCMVHIATRRPGKLAVFVGGHRWHGHALRETGFRSYVREYAPDFEVIETLVNLETRQVTHDATLDLLARVPDLAGIYVAGGGMEGAISALRQARAPGEVTLIVNELTPASRKALVDRYVAMVISTPIQRLCRELVPLMIAAVETGVTEVPGQYFLEPLLAIAESV